MLPARGVRCLAIRFKCKARKSMRKNLSVAKLSRLIRERLWSQDTQKIYLFGSYARGEADELSDIDIIVVKETKEKFFDRIRRALDLLNFDRAVDLLVYTPEEFREMSESGNAFIESVLEEGLLIYDRTKQKG